MRAPREEPLREEPVRPEYVEPRGYPGYARYPYPFGRDVTRWGPVVAGAIVSIALLVTLTTLGAAVNILTLGPNGATPLDLATGAGIWAAISALVALFLGGWLAGWAAGVRGWFSGLAHGTLVWALLLVTGLVLSGVGAAQFLGSVFGQFGSLTGVTPPPAGTTGTALLWTFVALVIAWAVAALGGVVGGLGTRETTEPAA